MVILVLIYYDAKIVFIMTKISVATMFECAVSLFYKHLHDQTIEFHEKK